MTEWRWIDVFARHLRACALTEGAFLFHVGLCVEVIRPTEPRWPIFQVEQPTAEKKNGK